MSNLRFKLWQIACVHKRDRLVHRYNPGRLTRRLQISMRRR